MEKADVFNVGTTLFCLFSKTFPFTTRDNKDPIYNDLNTNNFEEFSKKLEILMNSKSKIT